MSGSSGGGTSPLALPLSDLKPCVSVVVLECTATDPAAALGRLKADLRRLRTQRAVKTEVDVVADDCAWAATSGAESMKARLLDTLVNSARSSIIGYGADLEVFASA